VPATTITVAVLVMLFPPILPEIVAVPPVVPAVSVAVYVPSLLSVTGPREPRVVARTTVPPDVSSLFPLASFAWTVIVEVDALLASMEVGEADIVVLAAEATSGDPVAVKVIGVPVSPLTLA
jgi:hypothetical protein